MDGNAAPVHADAALGHPAGAQNAIQNRLLQGMARIAVRRLRPRLRSGHRLVIPFGHGSGGGGGSGALGRPGSAHPAVTGNDWTAIGSGAASAESSSQGRTVGQSSADSATPALARIPRTAARWTGSALWEAHMTATSASEKSNGARERDTVAWSGFMEERANATRSASPANATSAPASSTTAMSTTWTDSSSPLRTTRTSASAGIREAQTSCGI